MAATNWSSSVLSSLSSDTEPSILVTFDSAKYIFNAGENTGRVFQQSPYSWRRTKALFFTSVGTQRMSGLSGLLMVLADGGSNSLSIVGPRGLLHFLAALRLYTFRTSMQVNPIEVGASASLGDQSPPPVFSDNNISVYSIPIYPERASTTLKRKREPSPPVSIKRPFVCENKGTRRSSSPTVSLLDRMRWPAFSPTHLTGEDAQEWRKITVNHMFPCKQPPVVSKARKGEQNLQTAQSSSPDVSVSQGYQRFNLGGGDKKLPTFSFTKDEEPILPTLKPTLAYIIVGARMRGKFDAEKAKALGLFGPLRSQVASGTSVTFTIDDGQGGQIERTVKPEDCVGPSEIPSVVILLDIPSTAHIPALTAAFTDSQFFCKFRSDRDEHRNEFMVNAVYHLCGDDVLEDERYKEFMRGFSTNTHHIVSSKSHNADPVTFTSAALNQLRLNKLDSEMFPIPKFNLNPTLALEDVSGLPSNVYALRSNLLTQMRPPRPPITDPLITDEMDPFHSSVSCEAPLVLSNLTSTAFAKAERLVDMYKAKEKPPLPGDDVQIIPLGTSSALPTKYRNVSGNLVRIPGWGNILVEAGEGSWGQLARYFGTSHESNESVWKVLRDIKCIFVSHAHGDHHIGLAKLLAMRNKLDPPPAEPLYLITVDSVHLGLVEISDIEDLGIDENSKNNGVVPIHARALHFQGDLSSHTEPERRSYALAQDMCNALGLRKVSTVDVLHRTPCFGVVFDHKDNWSIVFSGDTRPCNKLVQAGQNATLLIHEASMDSDQSVLAQAKAHSTVGEAIYIGTRMNAENILLTHFSARYPNMPLSVVESSKQMQTNSDRERPTVGLAFDHANIQLGEFWKLNMYLPAIQQSFQEITQDEEDGESRLQVEW